MPGQTCCRETDARGTDGCTRVGATRGKTRRPDGPTSADEQSGEGRTGGPDCGRDQALMKSEEKGIVRGYGLPSGALPWLLWPVTDSMKAGKWPARENRRY